MACSEAFCGSIADKFEKWQKNVEDKAAERAA